MGDGGGGGGGGGAKRVSKLFGSLNFVGLDLGPHCLHRLPADNTGRERVNGF